MTNLRSETLPPLGDYAHLDGSRDELLDVAGRMEALLPVESDPTLAAPRLERTDPEPCEVEILGHRAMTF